MNKNLKRIAVDAISLIILIGIAIFLKLKSTNRAIYSVSNKYVTLFIIGGFLISLYITSVQIFGFEIQDSFIQKISTLAISGSGIIFMVIITLLIFSKNQNERMKIEADMNAELMNAQKEYFTMLLQKEEETKRFRHDIKEHLYCMNLLLKNKDYTQLENYFSKMDIVIPVMNNHYGIL